MNNPPLTNLEKLALFEYLLRLGDDSLIISHRLSEWCGHGPILEEDIALANIALDCLGQATMLLKYAGEVEGSGRNEDALAYWRDSLEFRNCRLTELPRGDFAFTICRQFLYSVFSYLMYKHLVDSPYETLQGIAAKGLKEVEYHLRHTRTWMLRLGDGTTESKSRLEAALHVLWDPCNEFFLPDVSEAVLVARGGIPDRSKLHADWLAMVTVVIKEATLNVPPDNKWVVKAGPRELRHTEHLGHLLCEMQIVARSHPGAQW